MPVLNTKMTIDTIANGALVEAFNHHLSIVLTDIADVNKPPRKKRSIILKIDFEPNEGRSAAEIKILTESKLPADLPISTSAYVDDQEAFEVVPEKNMELFGEDGKVVDFNLRREAK